MHLDMIELVRFVRYSDFGKFFEDIQGDKRHLSWPVEVELCSPKHSAQTDNYKNLISKSYLRRHAQETTSVDSFQNRNPIWSES